MTELSRRRARRLAVLTALLVAAVPASASAQASKTWVSGVGDDQNPCSRTAPCKTWYGAYQKTLTGGEINALDSGGYGSLTIEKSITIDGNGVFASTLACGTSGFAVNAAGSKVTIRDVSINGCRNTTSPGANGIRVTAAKSVRVENVRIFGFSNAGLLLGADQSKARVTVQRSRIHDNGNGVIAQAGLAGELRATLSRVRIDDNGNGVVVNGVNGVTKVRMFDSVVSDSGVDSGTGYGLSSNQPSASLRVGDSRIVGNLTALHSVNSGALISYGGNIVDENDTEGFFTGSVARK